MIAVTACSRLRAPLLSGPGAVVFDDVEGIGARANTWKAIRACPPGQDLLLLQDDIELPPGALPRMLSEPIPADVGIINWHDFGCDFLPWDQPAPGMYKFEAHPFGGRGMCGAQALTIPAENVAWLASCNPNARELLADIQGPHGADYAIGYWTQRGPQPWKLVARPSPVRHRGTESICHPTRACTPQAPTQEYAP